MHDLDFLFWNFSCVAVKVRREKTSFISIRRACPLPAFWQNHPAFPNLHRRDTDRFHVAHGAKVSPSVNARENCFCTDARGASTRKQVLLQKQI